MSSVIPKVSQLSKSIIRVLGCNPGPMTLQGTNTYIIGTGKKRLLLDTGEESNGEYIKSLTSVLKDEDIKLEKIIISHWHSDHIGGLQDVLKISNDDIHVLKFPRKCSQESITAKSFQWLTGQEYIDVEGASLRIVHTPGHTTDHIIIELKEENAVFSGDCILGEGTSVFEDLHDYMISLQTILDLKPQVIYPGHGPVIEDPAERLKHYISHRNQREQQIMDVMKERLQHHFTPMDLVKIIYMETPQHLHLAAASNVSHHLTKLEKEGRVICSDPVQQSYHFKEVNSSL